MSSRLAIASLTAVAAVATVAVTVTVVSDDGQAPAEVRGAVVTQAPDTATTVATTTSTAPSPALEGWPSFRATVYVPVISVHTAPEPTSPVQVELAHRNENDVPQTFLVKGEARDGDGELWLRVLLPVRPNGSTGWVRASEVIVEGVEHRLVVYLSDFRLELYKGDRLFHTFPIGVGTDETPTPGGEYYVKERFELTDPTSAYGSYAFGLNGFSNVLTDWRGGGVLGIHGTNRPDTIGTKASHGCIRMRNEDIEQLVPLVALGTPVEVVA